MHDQKPKLSGVVFCVHLVVTDNVENRTDEVLDFLRGPRLWIPQTDYPDFDDWVERVHRELKAQQKLAVVALESGCVVGSVVYQRHKQLESALEIKNISVRPDYRGRHLASFLLRNAEVIGSSALSTRVILADAKVRNHGIRMFLLGHHYRVLAQARDLYGLGAGPDVVYAKALEAPPTR